MRFQFVTSEILIGLRRNLTMTVAVIITTMVSLAIVGSALLVRSQISLMKGFWYDKVEVSVYLCDHIVDSPGCGGRDVTDAQRQQISQDLNSNPAIEKVYYESKAEAYKKFVKQFANSPDLVRNTNPEALPESYRVKLKNPKDIDVVASAVADEPGVDSVVDERKALDKLFRAMNGMSKAGLVVAVVALAACALMIFNTIRVAAFGRRRETGIMRLVGASSLYIQLPFLLEGALAGAVGAVGACGVLALGKYWLIDRVIAPSITFLPPLGWDAIFGVMPWLFVIALVLSGASSALAIQRHLRV